MRGQVCSEVAKGGYGRKAVVVRINSLDSPWGEDDIREVAKLTLDGVVIPKVEVLCCDVLYCCLLYTSPSPRDKRQSRMPSSA